jgi:hypothetical protein
MGLHAHSVALEVAIASPATGASLLLSHLLLGLLLLSLALGLGLISIS